MMRHFCPLVKCPSRICPVPYDFASFLLMSIGLSEAALINVDSGNAVYGTPHNRSLSDTTEGFICKGKTYHHSCFKIFYIYNATLFYIKP